MLTLKHKLFAFALAGAGILILTPVSLAQSNDVLNRINRLENELETLSRAVFKGEEPPPAIFSRPSNASQGNTEVRLQQLENDLRALTGRVEQKTFEIQQMRREMDQAVRALNQARIDTTVNTQPQAQIQPQSQPQPFDFSSIRPKEPEGLKSVSPTPRALTNSTPTAVYDQAFSLLKSGDYGSAEKEFARFLETYPEHSLAPNAQYWLGETYYVREDFVSSARIFAESYQKYPQGPKAADNLLKLGLSLEGMGKKQDACIALKQLVSEYPAGPDPVLRRGEQELKRLECS